MNIDPLTGKELPSNAIQRILFICPTIHIYQIPPLSSTKGYSAGSWTSPTAPTAQEIFELRLRIRLIETAIPLADASNSASGEKEKISVALLIEDKSSGELFAAVPYTDAGAVEPAVDSSRFFAIRVVGEGGRKAVLGLGFEERPEAVDFSIALQDARRVLGWEQAPGVGANAQPQGKGRRGAPPAPPPEEKRDFSLKEGETITVNFGGKAGKKTASSNAQSDANVDLSKFALKPPPGSGSGGGAMPFLPPPPSASEVKTDRGRRRQPSPSEVKDLGFDDGEFGEFQ